MAASPSPFVHRGQMTSAQLRAEAQAWERLDLRLFLATLGWRPGKPGQRNPPAIDTTANNLRMHRAVGEEISVGRRNDRYLFIDIATRQGGSITSYPVKFEGRRQGADACNFIREALGGERRGAPNVAALCVASRGLDLPVASQAIEKRRREIDAEFRAMAPLSESGAAYFARRGIAPATVLSNAYLIRQQRHGRHLNPVFGYAWHGVAYYETRWLDADGNSCKLGARGGYKEGLWLSRAPLPDIALTTIVIAESPVDALAYAHLFRADEALLAAFGGSLTHGTDGPQMRALMDLCARFPSTPVRLAVDADEAGDQFVSAILKSIPRAVAAQPFGVKDWCDVARQEAGA